MGPAEIRNHWQFMSLATTIRLGISDKIKENSPLVIPEYSIERGWIWLERVREGKGKLHYLL